MRTSTPGSTPAGAAGPTAAESEALEAPQPTVQTLSPPEGTRDLLPPEAAERRALSRGLAETLELHGYALVTTPPFELAETIERGLGADPRETLRFVDPESGEVSVFRPDLTVQIARIAASGLRDRPPPFRLYYEGHVIRARRGRARRQRQIAQVGAECIGVGGAAGDAEVIEIATRALDRVGLEHRVELSLVPMIRALCVSLPSIVRREVTEALARKDARRVERALAPTSVSAAHTRALVELESLTGGAEALHRARAVLAPVAEREVRTLEALWSALERRGLASRLRMDLGEVRGFDYYTGPSFALLAEGPGEPLGGGGRYDDLVGRFGRSLPASGFAIDLDHLATALRVQRAGQATSMPLRVCVTGDGAAPIADHLRAAGVRTSELRDVPLEDALHHAAAWQLSAVVAVAADDATIHWIGGAASICRASDLLTRLREGARSTQEQT